MKTFYQVAVNAPFMNSILTYESLFQIDLGRIVTVPLGKRKAKGLVVNLSTAEELKQVDHALIKQVETIDEDISFNKKEMQLLQWMSQYYQYPLGLLVNDIIPARPPKLGHIVFIEGKERDISVTLTDDQRNALNAIFSYGLSGFSKWLLHGVTGAGKTIVYLQVMKKVLEEQKSVLFLLPEINLTPQFLQVFEKSLNVPIFIYNSTLSKKNKYALWAFLQTHQGPVLIVGVRSSIFLPIKNLGLIIVDEEHDQSFKQEDHCAYNARDVAIKKASLENFPIILGSATPMAETYLSFKDTPFYLPMKKRANDSELPSVILVDTRGKSTDLWPLAEKTLGAIKERLQIGEQILVFINRLGYANYLQCRACGHQFSCPNCTTSLKFYKKKQKISCQTCDYEESSPEMCPECMNLNLIPKGFGTEKVHELLLTLLPDYKIERFDRDEITTMKKLEDVLNRFHQKEIDILVGTQMLSKGHNFKNVNLVVVLGIDSQLNFPDFRSNERVYQTLMQVSGRGGRYGKKAEVYIQTLAPENKVFTYALNKSFDDFYTDELSLRKICEAPPYVKMIAVFFSSKSQSAVVATAEQVGSALRQLGRTHFKNVDVLGPRPSMIEKKVNKFTWSIVLKSNHINELHNCLKTALRQLALNRNVDVKVDVDPYYFD